MAHDLVIAGGTVVDGTGTPARRADVAIDGDRIVAVGEVDATGARQVIDADGRIVTPGFVDIHSHLDAQIGWEHPDEPHPMVGEPGDATATTWQPGSERPSD